jgi:hypothetical protein
VALDEVSGPFVVKTLDTGLVFMSLGRLSIAPVAKDRLERIGDHATNIGENPFWRNQASTGFSLPHLLRQEIGHGIKFDGLIVAVLKYLVAPPFTAA